MNIAIFARGDYSLANRRVDSLREKGHKVYFISLQKHTLNHHNNIYIKPVGQGLLAYLLTFPRIFKLLNKLDFEVADFHGASSYGLFSILLKEKFIISIYGPDIYIHAQKNKLIKKLINILLKRASRISCSTITVTDYLESFDGLDENKYVLLPYGIRPFEEGEHEYQTRRESFRLKFAIRPHEKVILHGRRFMSFWRVDKLAEAFATLNDENSKLIYVFPTPFPEEQELLKKVKKYLCEKNVLDRVIFIDGLAYDEYLSILCAADLFICIGENDLLANSILEGMLCRNQMVLNNLKSYTASLANCEISWIEETDISTQTIFDVLQSVLRASENPINPMLDINSNFIIQNYLESVCADKVISTYESI